VTTVPDRLAAALRRADHVVVLTGSGVSAESGIPTFRDAQTGLWARFQPEELATPEAFERDPALVWQWYQWRRELVARARPAAGHLAIAALERLLARLTLVTQNVDGLHQQAGSQAVIEFHGNIWRNRCAAEGTILAVETSGTTKPPRCPSCGARVRPDVTWFGEPIAPTALMAAEGAIRTCDVFIAVGTSAVVQPAAGLADAARRAGALLVEVNPQDTPLSGRADVALRDTAGNALTAMVDILA
jgi:NAD-dependent deacetylase